MEIMKEKSPSALVLPRDNKEISNDTKISGVEDGIYLVRKTEYEDYINLISNGEELGITLKLSENLESIGIHANVYSAPCLKNAKESIKEKLSGENTIAITLGVKNYYFELTKKVISIDEFSISGKKQELLDYFGFNEPKLESKILEILNKENKN